MAAEVITLRITVRTPADHYALEGIMDLLDDASVEYEELSEADLANESKV